MRIKTLKLIYNSLATSYLSYGVTAWGACPQTTLNKLQTLQNKIIRYMYFIDPYTSISNILLEHSILNVYQTYFYEVSKLMHSISNCRNPDAFNEYFTFTTHSHSTRNSENTHYFLPQPRTNLGKRSICYNGVTIWSKIPNNIKSITNIKHFKELTKLFIVENIETP